MRPRYQGVMALAFGLAALQTVAMPGVYLWLGVVLAGALVVTVPVIEWRLGTDRLLGSLPVRRRTVVAARYVAAALAIAVAWAAWTIAGRLLGPILRPAGTGVALWATLNGALAFLAICTALVAVFLPLHFRLGVGRGMTAFAGVLIGAYALAVAGHAALVPAGARFLLPGAVAREVAGELIARTGGVAAVAVVVGGSCLVLAGSGVVAAWGFWHRDL